jgi:hypothetical protein
MIGLLFFFVIHLLSAECGLTNKQVEDQVSVWKEKGEEVCLLEKEFDLGRYNKKRDEVDNVLDWLTNWLRDVATMEGKHFAWRNDAKVELDWLNERVSWLVEKVNWLAKKQNENIRREREEDDED